MTRVIAQNSDLWTLRKIQFLVDMEAAILKKQISRVQNRISDFENRYGKSDRESLYGLADDMELLEWEGEIETMARLREKLASLEQIAFEYE